MTQFEVYIANLNPTIGNEINKTRPVVIISPDELNRYLKTVIIAPITSKAHDNIPTRIEINIDSSTNYVVLDQIRTLDKGRLFKKVTQLSKSESDAIQQTLIEMFS